MDPKPLVHISVAFCNYYVIFYFIIYFILKFIYFYLIDLLIKYIPFIALK